MSNFRCVLEVLKLSSPLLALSGAAIVCREWHSASESSELWLDFLLMVGYDPSVAFPKDPKSAFRSSFQPLALVTATKLATFGCFSQRFRRRLALSEVVCADDGSAYAHLPNSALFVCGGGRNQAFDSSYSISLLTGQVSELPSMLTGRRFHAAIYYQGTAFVFGGSNTASLQSCESLAIGKDRWKFTYNMIYTRCIFTVCEYKAWFYICGGLETDYCEVYSPKQSIGKLIPLTLPERSATSCVVRDGQLVIVSRRFVTVWDVEKGESMGSSKRRHAGDPRANMTARVIADSIFLAFNRLIHRIDLSTSLNYYTDFY